MFARRMQQWLVACLVAWPAVAAAADGDRVVTNKDLVAQMRAVWTKTILDTYDATADADAPWNDDARRFIDNYITLLSSMHTTSLELPPLEDVERMGRELLAAGCDEPIIHIIYGRTLFGQGMIGEAMPYLRSGYERCRLTPNLELLVGTTAMRLAQGMTALGRGGDQVEQYYAEAVAAVAQAAGNTMYVEDEQSALLEIIRYYCSNDLPAENGDEFVAQCVAQEHSRRWLCMMLAGLRHLEAVRTSGYSGPRGSSSRPMPGILVGQYGQSGENGEESTVEAERLLTAAWELRPERPQAAAAMIRLETYTDYTRSGLAKAWFDRAVEAQADYGPAHYAYILHILRGDIWNMDDILRRYGRRCLAGNYETFAPSYYFTAMTFAAHNENESYYRYGQNPRSYLDGPEASAGFKKMLKGYDRAELSGELLRYVSLMGAAVSCLSRDWQQAREYLDAVDDLPGHIDRAEWFFRQVDLSAGVAIAQAYAETGPATDALAAARAQYKQRNYDAALAILTDAAEVHRDDYWTTAYLHHSIRHTLMKRDLAAGEWVDITPDVGLAGWQTVRGQVWVDPQGRVVCRAGSDHQTRGGWSMLLCDRSFGGAYELRARVVLPGGERSGTWAGPVFGSYMNGPYRLHHAAVLSADGQVLLLQRDYSEVQQAVAIEKDNTVYVQVWNQNVSVFVNGEPAIPSFYIDEMPSGDNASKAKVGVGVRQSGPMYVVAPHDAAVTGELAAFDDIQVRLLTGPPAKDEFDGDYSDRLRLSTYSPAYGDERVAPLATAPAPAQPAPAPTRVEPDDTDGEETPVDRTSTVINGKQVHEMTIELEGDVDFDPHELVELLGLVIGRSTEEENAATIERLEVLLEDETLSEGARQVAEQLLQVAEQAQGAQSPSEQLDNPDQAEGGDAPVDSPVADGSLADDEDEAAGEVEEQLPALPLQGRIRLVGVEVHRQAGVATMVKITYEPYAPTDPPAAEDDPDDVTDEDEAPAEAPEEEAESPADAPSEDGEAPASHPTDDGNRSTDDDDAEVDLDERRAAIVRRDAAAGRLHEIGRALEAYANAPPVIFESVTFLPPESDGSADGDSPTEELDADGSAAAVEPVMPAVDNSLFRTELLGGKGGEAFEDTLAGPGYLVGVRLRFTGEGEINSVQPIYRTPGGRRYGGRAGLGVGRAVLVVARDGYAVGAVIGGGEDSPGGARLVFMRVTPDGRLDETDSYRSQPYGPTATGLQVTTEGRLPIGLAGRMGETLQAVGLVATDEGDLAGVDLPTDDLGPTVVPAPPAPPARAQAKPSPADDQQAATTDDGSDAPTLGPAELAALGDVVHYGDHWYKAFYTMMTWHDAKAHCQSLGGHLIYINDAQENEFAKWFVHQQYPILWIGATDEAEAGHWLWLDGAELEYSDWGENEPNVEGGEHAAALVRTDDVSGWNNLPAATELMFLCEWDHDPTAPAGDEDDSPQEEDNDE